MSSYDEAREAAARAVFGADGPHTHPWEIQHHARKDEFRTMANAALDAFLAKLSETHAVVPREPTEAMLDAVAPRPAHWPPPGEDRKVDAAVLTDRLIVAQRYRAMIGVKP